MVSPNLKFGGGIKPLLPPVAQTVQAFRRRDLSLLPSAFLDTLLLLFGVAELGYDIYLLAIAKN
jgi:hypothetical protein